MDNSYTGPLLLLILVIVELFLMIYVKKEEIPWREVVFNFSSGHILMWILRLLELAVFTFVLNNYSLNWVTTWPIALQWIFTFFAWDFCFYCLHYFHHKIPLFWYVHVIHHEGEHYGLSLGIRNSWYSSVTSIPFFLILAVLGVPLEIFIPISSFHYFMQFYNHNNIVKKSGILEKFMITPAHHRVHHGQNTEYVDKNCGGTLVIWDKMFGTFQEELPDVQIKYGVKDAIKSDNPFWGNNIPLFEALHIKLPDFNKPNTNKIETPDWFIVSSGLTLWGLVLYFIYCINQGQGFTLHQIVFFWIIFLATIFLGGVSDGKYWAVISWVILALLSSVSFVLYFQVFDIIPLAIFISYFLHGAYALKYLSVNNKNKLSQLGA